MKTSVSGLNLITLVSDCQPVTSKRLVLSCINLKQYSENLNSSSPLQHHIFKIPNARVILNDQQFQSHTCKPIKQSIHYIRDRNTGNDYWIKYHRQGEGEVGSIA